MRVPAMTRTKLWLATAGTLALFLILALAAALLLHPKGLQWLVVAAVVVLGAVAAGLVYFYLSRRLQGTAAPDDTVDAAAAAARNRLAAAGSPKHLPTILVLGPPGSTKSTVVTESGLEPELIAGEARRGVATPTTVNVWFAQGTVLVEAGGALLDEPARWNRLLRHFRPGRFRAALTGRAQAPRLALVCYPCDELLRPGAAESIASSAQALRERLLEVARQFGVRLPVYVLFTRADRFPHFTEYVRSLSREEAQEVLGATLPALPPVAAALHAERETQRLADTFRGLVRSLALRRGDLLGREVDGAVRASAYELPRELRKASDAAVRFLVELTRPSHLGISPFLRGFYFTGVRPVVVDDGVAAVTPVRSDGAIAATGVFDARSLMGGGAPAPAAARTGRRVPEWVFLRRLFPEVILADRAAAGATAGGSRVHALRRAGLAAAAVAFLVLAAGFTTSFVSNRGLEARALSAARAAPRPEDAAAGVASTDALRRLDGLRAEAARLRAYETSGTPLHLEWGLYSGSALLPEMRQAYFRVFDRLLWQGTRARMLASLQALPTSPDATSAYGTTFDALKAHLVTTTYPDSSSGSFLGPVLLRYWADATPDAERTDLARRQFEFFGAELPHGNPFPAPADAQLVDRTRRFLAQFGDEQRVYAALLSEANTRAPSIQFSRLAPDAAPSVRDEVIVPGAFTRTGWTYVQARLRDVSKLFNSEPWVVGPAAAAPRDQARLARTLADQYAAEYVARWRAFLVGASVGGLSGPEDVSRTLGRLSDPRSPLLRLLSLASTNTAVDTSRVAPAFVAVRAVVPAGASEKLILPPNADYIKGLTGTKAALDQVLAAPPGQRGGMMGQVAPAVDQARGAVMQIAQGFPIDGPGRDAGAEVRRLLEAPLNALGGVVQALPSADANGKGKSFCRSIAPSLAKYPFNPRSTADATLEELGQLFQPGSNAFSQYAGQLQDLVVPSGSGWAAKIGATPAPSPAFVAFLNRASSISHALYEGEGQGPVVAFTLKPQTSADLTDITVSVDGQTHTFTRTNTASYPFTWDGTHQPHDARISKRVGNVDTPLLQGTPGPWALFRLLQQADWQRAGNGWTLRWRLPQGGELTADLAFAKGTPVFKSDFFGGLSCVSEVVR